ncbi:MAG: efflux RND transporter periplasmic adaptor subunit [Noviherbaspirillum sp.]
MMIKTACFHFNAAACVALLAVAGRAHGAGAVGCLIEPERVADLGTPTAGVIRAMMVERGDRVRRGQVIAVLQDDIERATVDVAQSRAQADAEVRAALAGVELAQQKRDRSHELHGRGFISAQALEQSLTETRVAEEKLLQSREQKRSLEKESALARVRLGERTIRSPIDGVVVERYFSAGERVEEKPMVRVARVDPLRIEVILPSAMYGSVRAGGSGRVATELPGMTPVVATVSLVDKVLDAASGTFRVRMLLPNPDGRIPAGLRCKVEFDAPAMAAVRPAAVSATIPPVASPGLRMDFRGITMNPAPASGRRM